jgi:hypothetical protein
MSLNPRNPINQSRNSRQDLIKGIINPTRHVIIPRRQQLLISIRIANPSLLILKISLPNLGEECSPLAFHLPPVPG